jgi:FKBP-type peptidyl-prolyl cis-trans isomerase
VRLFDKKQKMKIVFPFALLISCFSIFFSSCLDTNNEPVLSFEDQWKKDTTAMGVYLRSKNINALKDASGVRFIIDSLASGFPPKNSSTVSFTYTGRFLSGTVFDEGDITGVVSTFIGGFQVGLSLLPEGTKARLFIPSGYGYGTAGSKGIPANAILMFEVRLTDVVTSETEKQRLATDTVAIDNYLATNSIDAVRDKSGLRYVITQLGTGPKPSLYSKVKINYTGKVLSSGTTFFSGTSEPTETFDSRVINYLYAFQVAFPKLPVGTKATLYIPSGLGYGTQAITSGGVTVPANSNLVYDIELVDIED